jgi:hypothetical protein
MVARGHLPLGAEGGESAPESAGFLAGFGIELQAARVRRRISCRPCLGWIERRPHLGDALRAAILDRDMGLDWIERVRETPAVCITPARQDGLTARFEVGA